MSLARAVTKRMKRSDVPKEPTSPTRSQSVRTPFQQIDRSKISLPMALVSTTNMLSYNAPDIATMRHVSSSTSLSNSSAEDSDHSVSTRSRASSQASRDTMLTEASSVESSSPISPKVNHPAGFFPSGGKQIKKSASTTSLQQVKEEVVEPVPEIPSRALSHSKRAHERLAHKRSLQHVPGRSSINSRSSGSVRSVREQRSSVDIFKATIEEEAHPFGKELEQLNEVVEEFGGVVRDAESEADLTVMRSKNLAAFCASDYLSEIQPLFTTRFGLVHQAPPMAWI
ncbi:hypothetical protein NX059_003910 [Plenodomus lindquistii]|nr:hypothetical protein NX059_003910 [Plenodomus lindquistii]